MLQHHLTAFVGVHLRDLPLTSYLDGATAARPGEVWPGYPARTTVGLRLERHTGEQPADPLPSEDYQNRDLTAATLGALRGLGRALRSPPQV